MTTNDTPCHDWQPIAELATVPDDELVLIVNANRRGHGGVLEPVPQVWRVSIARDALARAEQTPRHLRLAATHFARFAGFPAQTSTRMEMAQ